MSPRHFTVALMLAAWSVGSGAAAAETHTKGAKPARIALGQEVALADYLVPGKTVVFDFTSDYCPPCRAIAPLLENLHATRDDVAVVSVDINRPGVKLIDLKSPVARQYDLPSVPYFKVYGPDGKLVAEGDAARTMVIGWFK